jgi:hypothetical protein
MQLKLNTLCSSMGDLETATRLKTRLSDYTHCFLIVV